LGSILKCEKIINIRNSQLRRVRNNLRAIIIHAVGAEVTALDSLKWSYDERNYDSLSEPEKLESYKLYRDKWDLQFALSKSICRCYTCGMHDRDMVYNTYLKAWNCVDCTEKGKVWLPWETPCKHCGSDHAWCPKCGLYYCPSCITERFKEFHKKLKNDLEIGISKEESLIELDEDNFRVFKGECECGYSLIKHSKLRQWQKMRSLFGIF